MQMRSALKSIVVVTLPLLILYFLIPLFLLFFPQISQHVFFLNFVKLPYVEYQNLSKYDISHGINFYVNGGVDHSGMSGDGEVVTLGVWHILPRSLHGRLPKDVGASWTPEQMGKLVRDGERPIVVYFHGNAFDRTTTHRRELYRLLADKLDMHVLALDYRGYGDSTGRPTELGVVEDAKTIVDYVERAWKAANPIFVWGHSMGTGIGTRAVAELSIAGRPPRGLILEAPFNNLPDVISYHPFSLPFRILPWFRATMIEPLLRSGLVFSSDVHIKRVDCPILVLHAQDDHIIPAELGQRLVRAARSADRIVQYVEFDKSRGLMHKYICQAEELPDILTKFFTSPSVSVNVSDKTTAE